MKIFRSRCNRRMAQSLTEQVDGCSPVESVGSVAMPQPVSASLFRNPRTDSRFLDQVSNRNPVQAAAVSCFPTPKNWRANSQHFLCCSELPNTETQEVAPRESCRPCHKSRIAHFHRQVIAHDRSINCCNIRSSSAIAPRLRQKTFSRVARNSATVERTRCSVLPSK